MERALACGEGGKERLRALSRPLTGVCCDGSPERLVDPCLELNLFHDSANLPLLALRLRLRFSALSSRSEQPRSISPASLHFFPMLSSPLLARQHPGAGRSRLFLSPPGLTSSGLAPPLPPRAPGRARRSDTAAATRLRLRLRLAKLGCDCERHLRWSQLPFAPQISLPPTAAAAFPGGSTAHSWDYCCATG